MAKIDTTKLSSAANAVKSAKFSYSNITTFGRFFNRMFLGYRYVDEEDINKILNAIYKEKDQISEFGVELRDICTGLNASKEALKLAQKELKDIKIADINYAQKVEKKIKKIDDMLESAKIVINTIRSCIDR